MTALRPFLLACCIAYGQTSPSFDAASIKHVAPTGPYGKGPVEASTTIAPGSVRMHNASVRDVIALAYGIKDHQIAGPAWIGVERYDIEAKSEGPTSEDQLKL